MDLKEFRRAITNLPDDQTDGVWWEMARDLFREHLLTLIKESSSAPTVLMPFDRAVKLVVADVREGWPSMTGEEAIEYAYNHTSFDMLDANLDSSDPKSVLLDAAYRLVLDTTDRPTD